MRFGLPLLLNIKADGPMIYSMKNSLVSLFTAASLVIASPVFAADCYADYKAKQDNPLRLHYGVARISQCSAGAARAELAPRLAAQGWTLLNIVSVFDDSGLERRKQNAGPYFLRF